ncbi:MAG TPA: phosphotransferase [Streptosporangiaceae bacterium]|jgi:aminoglycoside phosphotransferase (APT) family kinase protein|nr:phosphotransferase [Streptosporangiaceae bacterium]
MNGKYVGYVAGHDPLHDFLGKIIRDRMDVREPRPAFRAFRLSGSNVVYAYEEKFSGTKIFCKFYGPRFAPDWDMAAWKARQEYEGLETLRRYHLIGSPHHVIRPLGFHRDINGVLATEYYAGEEFSQAIARATCHRDDAHLFWRLKALAYFLATQHDRTAIGVGVDFDADCEYFDTVAGRLRKAHRIGQGDVNELSALRDRWRDKQQMWQDQQVWLHGDATPANFLFGDGLDVAAIDLERMKRGDRMFDVGRVAGELQHAFMRDTGDRHRAEPFIEHFLQEYSRHFPDRQRTFESVKTRVPYYMALNLLRIARNDYIDGYYGGRLVRQAKRLLKAA